MYGVSAIIGARGLSLDASSAVVPPWVKQQITFTLMLSATSLAATVIALETPSFKFVLEFSKFSKYSGSFSISIAILSTACITFSGCAPIAVSADNITASTPSYIACATSDTSARVGVVE